MAVGTNTIVSISNRGTMAYPPCPRTTARVFLLTFFASCRVTAVRLRRVFFLICHFAPPTKFTSVSCESDRNRNKIRRREETLRLGNVLGVFSSRRWLCDGFDGRNPPPTSTSQSFFLNDDQYSVVRKYLLILSIVLLSCGCCWLLLSGQTGTLASVSFVPVG